MLFSTSHIFTKKIYYNTINSISKTQTLASHIKCLDKLKLSTEDIRLKKLLSNCINLLRSVHAKSKSKSTPSSLLNAKNLTIIELTKYCNAIIVKEIPEWQINATRNGWRPIK